MIGAYTNAGPALHTFDIIDPEFLLFLNNRVIRALGFTGPAFYALLFYHKSHVITSAFLRLSLYLTTSVCVNGMQKVMRDMTAGFSQIIRIQ